MTTEAIVFELEVDDYPDSVDFDSDFVSMDETLSFPIGSAVGDLACATVTTDMDNDAADPPRWVTFYVSSESVYADNPDRYLNVIIHDDEVVGVSMVAVRLFSFLLLVCDKY